MRAAFVVLALVAVSAAGAGGYWAGQAGVTVIQLEEMLGISVDAPVPLERAMAAEMPSTPVVAAELRRVLYWRDPDGKPSYSASPKRTDDGRDFIAVRDDGASAASTASPAVSPVITTPGPLAASDRKVRSYRNPMGLPDTSPVPKKDGLAPF
ncbi:hypothetical protein Sa4125_18340 [Aureimonas sp. SA4125]|uniref:hypothetical protein n=1 Tax=Aureimonas sp. SA4125 TaxID=2826993 RepID=UPI001CC81B14|nr:hypothetical protein [Aureimonas sp. SA4125]BDA84292.1 hypothetical protein Sa4125_18340 [Aureimonas sp. SA4125]